MEFPKPPPLKPKPACPTVARRWNGANPRLVRLVVVVSIGFWLFAVVGPMVLGAVLGWHLLEGRPAIKLIVIASIAAVSYFSYSFGNWAATVIILSGALKRKTRGAPQVDA